MTMMPETTNEPLTTNEELSQKDSSKFQQLLKKELSFKPIGRFFKKHPHFLGFLFGIITCAIILCGIGFYLIKTERYILLKPIRTVDSDGNSLDEYKLFEDLSYYIEYVSEHAVMPFTYSDMMNHISNAPFLALNDPYSKLRKPLNRKTLFTGLYFSQDQKTGTIYLEDIEQATAEEFSISKGLVLEKINNKYANELSLSEVKALQSFSDSVPLLEFSNPSSPGSLMISFISHDDFNPNYYFSEILDDSYLYIHMYRIEPRSTKLFLDDIKKYQEDPSIKGLILDLRNNPGGSVSNTEQIADALLPDQTLIASYHFKNHKEDIYAKSGFSWDIPMVVLGNEYSASGSEVIINALRDNNRATFVGVTTKGKGIQQTNSSSTDISYSLTTAYNYSPNGKCIDKIGITPDEECPLEKDFSSKAPYRGDSQLIKAMEVLQEKIDHE